MEKVTAIQKQFNSYKKPYYRLTYSNATHLYYSRSLMNIEDMCNFIKRKSLNIDFLETCDIKEIRENYEYIKLKSL